MSDKYDVTFSGEIKITEDISSVKEKTQKIMKLSDAQLHDFFSGKKVLIKKNISFQDAQALKAKIEQLGLIIALSPSQTIAQPTKAQPSSNLTIEKAQSTLKEAVQAKNPPTSLKEVDNDHYYDEIDDQVLEGAAPPTFALNLDGRFGSLNFLNAQLRLIGILLPFGAIYAILLMKDSPEAVLNAFKITILVVYAAFSYRLVALRLQDLNHNHWFFVIFLTIKIPDVGPYIVLLFVLYLVFMPGSKEMNQYGTPTEQGSKLGIIAFLFLVPAFAGASFYLGQQQNAKVKFVEEGIALTQELKDVIQSHYTKRKKLPTSLYELNMSIMSPDPAIIIGVELLNNSEIKIHYSFKVKQEGYLTLMPIINDEVISWRCHKTNLEEKTLPHPCRTEVIKS